MQTFHEWTSPDDYHNYSSVATEFPSHPNTFPSEAFFYTAEYLPDVGADITFVTQMTVDRMDRLCAIAKRYGGKNML